MIIRAAGDESGELPDEQIVELAFVVGYHQHVYLIFCVSVLRGIEWKDFDIFVDQDVDADCWIYVFKFRCLREFEREIEFGVVQFVKEFSVVVQFIGVFIYSMNMPENALEVTVIVFEMQDIKDSVVVQGLGRLYVRPAPIVGRQEHILIVRHCTESKRHPLPIDNKLAM